MWEHPHRPLSSCFLPHFPQTFLPPHVQHVHLSIFFAFSVQSKIWFLFLSGTWYNSSISLPSSSIWSLSSLFFIQNTSGILPFCSPSMCQSCHSYCLCTCPTLSIEYSLLDLCMNVLFCRHSDLRRSPKWKCLFCFLPSIHYVLKLSYSFVLMLIFTSLPSRKWALGGRPCPWPSPVWVPWTHLLNSKNHHQQASFFIPMEKHIASFILEDARIQKLHS